MSIVKLTAIVLWLALLAGCETLNRESTLYDDLGGKPVIERITGNFIREIGYDPQIVTHFEESDLDRFYEKMVEHLCEISGGPCEYTGDSMLESHQGMNISEAEFNRTVDLLINAMDKADVPKRLQNRLLARLAPLREDIIYQ
jgi:hemoglobin